MSAVVVEKINDANLPFEPRATNVGARWFMKNSNGPASPDLLRKYALSSTLQLTDGVFTCWDLFDGSYELRDGVWVAD
jgi:hypothetical protein